MLALAVMALPTHFIVKVQGREVGTADITTKALENGELQVLTNMNLRNNGSESVIRQETIYKSDGSQRRALIETVVNKTERTFIVAEFNDAGASLTTTIGNKTTRRDVKLDPRAPRANPSTFWFIKTGPKVGEKAVFYSLRLSTQEWSLQESVYKGQETITVSGEAQKAHRVDGAMGVTWLDAKGHIVALEAGGLRLERVNVAPNPKTID